MTALEVIENITENENLLLANFKYCLVTSNKIPIRYDGLPAKPNRKEDFVDLELILTNKNLNNFAGLGISIQASQISAIDIDNCCDIPFDKNYLDDRAKNLINLFKNDAYIEFSFSGKGLRIFFKSEIIHDYSKKYYIKNSNKGIEYYQSSDNSFRYVTITGKSIINNEIKLCPNSIINTFLDNFMLRPKKFNTDKNLIEFIENKTYDELEGILKHHAFINSKFQNAIFDKFNKNMFGSESDQDWYILTYIYANITKDKNLIKQLFENTYYFKHKDNKHLYKWNYNNFRYYNYLYDRISM